MFKGDIKEYTLAIQELDEAENSDDAMQRLNAMKEKFNWNSESEAFEMINSLTERRHQ